MKKLLLSGFVIITFVIYSLQQRHESAQPVTIAVKPEATQSAQSTESTTTSQNMMKSGNQQMAQYKDGTYDGDIADAYYGNIQVEVDIKDGQITDVRFLQYPNDRRTSVEINNQAMPYLRQEAIKAQSSRVNVVSGASDTSAAFIQSLSSALAKA